MTAGQSSEVDLDLLADYLGGVLVDTPEEAVVTGLIDTDPEWAAAYEALRQAFDSVGQRLDDFATSTSEPMPTEITDRLTAALAAAGPVDQPAIPAQSSEVPGRRITAVPGSGGPVAGSRGRTNRSARRRWARMAGSVAVAAATVAFAGFGLSRLTTSGGTGASDNSDAPAVTSVPLSQPDRILATGTDYTSATISRALAALGPMPADGKERHSTESAVPPSGGSMGTMDTPAQGRVPNDLARLNAPDALAACLDAISLTHGLGPLTVKLVDLAAYEGTPALVVAFTDRVGGTWAWVSGSDCGLPTSGPDTLYRAQVG